jgi:hypothetical protein
MKRKITPDRWFMLVVLLAAPDARAQFPSGASALEPARRVASALPARMYTKDDAFYDPKVLRTLHLEFPQSNWQALLAANYHTDVDLPAKLTVDGKAYPGVGVSFRGNSSYTQVPYGKKHSLNIAVDAADAEQDLYGYQSLKLLNANQDPTFMRTFLYHHITRHYIPSPKVNFVRLVVNGEYLGIYVNTQQINSDLTKEQFGSGKGTRWKIDGNRRGTGGLVYLGEDISSYRYSYELKSKEDPEAWAALVALCRTLNRTPPDQLEAALKPMLDLEGALKFLALDHALQNADGYWAKAGEYTLYRDIKGIFHVIPWDVNESFKEPGGRGGGGGGSDMLDPYAGSGDPNKALLYRLLAVPALEQRYLGYIRDIAENWLTWDKIGPVVAEAQALIRDDIAADTRKLYSTQAFSTAVDQDYYDAGNYQPRAPAYSLRGFVNDRRVYLLSYPGIAKAPLPAAKAP